jgi:hypothetical protein
MVLHDLVVGDAVVVGLVIVHIADVGMGGVDGVVDGDAANLIIYIVLQDATSGLALFKVFRS